MEISGVGGRWRFGTWSGGLGHFPEKPLAGESSKGGIPADCRLANLIATSGSVHCHLVWAETLAQCKIPRVYVFSVADGGRFWFDCERGGAECLGASLLLVGGTLGRMLIWDQSRDTFLSSMSANLPYIASTILWVYWGVCISDMVPFYAGRQAARSGTGNLIREKLGVSQAKFDQIKANVQRYGNLIGIVERFSLGVRNPTSFLAGFVGIKPMNYFAGVCVGALMTLPLQMGVGVLLRDRPIAALAGVAAVVGIWTLLPYIAAGIGSIVYIRRRRGRKQSSETVEDFPG